jgi:uncharacterized protein HemX
MGSRAPAVWHGCVIVNEQAKVLYSASNLDKMHVERGQLEPQSLRRDKLASGSHLSAGGGRMRNLLIVMVATLCLGFSLASTVRAQSSNLREQRKQLKVRQKQERKTLKLLQKNQNHSRKGQVISKAVRLQAKHQRQRDRRAMRDRQKDERQDLKDRQRALRESQRAYGQ